MTKRRVEEPWIRRILHLCCGQPALDLEKLLAPETKERREEHEGHDCWGEDMLDLVLFHSLVYRCGVFF